VTAAATAMGAMGADTVGRQPVKAGVIKMTLLTLTPPATRDREWRKRK
jgi:hypothetical protein